MVLNQDDRIRVRRWPTERPLFILNAIASAGLWFLFARSRQSLAYVGMVVAFFGMSNLAFIAYIRGSAVRLGTDQFPELYARVAELARRIGLRRTPEVYLLQQDGALNAFAARFLRSHMVVLLSDLLEACGDNRAAEDMIIGHELGHIRSGHLLGRWLLLPASFVPFLGSALSRAREYTCDRYGCALAADREAALVGLAILAAGGRYGPLVNRAALAQQRGDLRGVWMVVGEWLGSHPPLSKRLVALAPGLKRPVAHHARAALGWLRPPFAAAIVVIVGSVALYAYLPLFGIKTADRSKPRPTPGLGASDQVSSDLKRLRSLIETDRRQGRPLPWDVWALYARWTEVHPKDKDGPVDPFSGYWYEYDWKGDAYRLWSVGPDGKNHTADDVMIDSRMIDSRKRASK